MSKKALILCVDDEPVNLAILEELLQDDYELSVAGSGDSCLTQVKFQVPDLVLLDVNMPAVDGLETCRRLKADPATADIPVIFVSALASHQELMAGYEVGGDDYITKPFSEAILKKKIQIVLANQKRKRELEKISATAVKALQDNLTNTEELGMIVKFLHQCQIAHTHDEIASNVFDCLREFDLDGSLLILAQPENRIWFSDDIDRPMERQILESLRGQDRIVNFGTRIAINSDHVTILVRNLPTLDEHIERIREHLTILIGGLDARIHALQSQQLLDERRKVLARVLTATRESLHQLDEQHRTQKCKSSEILSAMGTELQKSLLKLDLTNQQEAALMKIIENTRLQIELVYDEGLEIDERFQGVIDELSTALEQRSKEGEGRQETGAHLFSGYKKQKIGK